MDNNIYIGFNAVVSNHNWSLSLLYKSSIFAIEIERLNRLKDFPNNDFSKLLPSLQREMFNIIDDKTKNKDKVIAFRNYLDDIINEILIKLDIDFKPIDNIFIINFPFDISVRGFENKVKSYKRNNHHLFHATSAYYPSEFNESAILCMDHDGYDEDLGGINPMHSIWYANGNKIDFLYSDNFDPKTAQAGIGSVYENHSRICGIGEGTFMGLSGYGKNNLDDIKIFDYTSGGVLLSKDFLSKDSYEGLEDFRSDIIDGFRKSYGIKGKKIEGNIENSIYSDIADKVQLEIEEAIVFLANKAYELTGSKNICIAGGVGLNILANNRILKDTKFENIFVQPACNDAGLSLGGLYYLYHTLEGNSKRIKLESPGIGFVYSEELILKDLEYYKEDVEYINIKTTKYSEIAQILKDDNIIGWFQGKSEFGPRALGFRSILASPISKGMKQRVNLIKEREQYRPLAPIMMEDYFTDYLDTKYSSPYMTLVADVKEIKKDVIPSVVHVDGTARYQTVNANQNKEVHNLLNEFNKLTGVSVLINTSFNAHDEPIIETPKEAINMFLSTDIDYLIIGDYKVSKKRKLVDFKFSKDKVEESYDKKINQAKNNNLRGNTLLLLLGISKLGFNYNYNIGDKGVHLNYNNHLSLIIEVLDSQKKYTFTGNNIGLRVIESGENSVKLLKIIEVFFKKNEVTIFNLIRNI